MGQAHLWTFQLPPHRQQCHTCIAWDIFLHVCHQTTPRQNLSSLSFRCMLPLYIYPSFWWFEGNQVLFGQQDQPCHHYCHSFVFNREYINQICCVVMQPKLNLAKHASSWVNFHAAGCALCSSNLNLYIFFTITNFLTEYTYYETYTKHMCFTYSCNSLISISLSILSASASFSTSWSFSISICRWLLSNLLKLAGWPSFFLDSNSNFSYKESWKKTIINE